ncbi:MAG: pyridoxal-phosphate dependent enzyme [bacterium]|nr:pyridoxal-phosphate dependent enzyme [bacterium]
MAQLACIECKRDYPVNEPIWRCECGGLLDLEFEPLFPLEKIEKRKPSMWRYREAIPIEDDAHVVSFDEGFTSLLGVGFNVGNGGDKTVLIKQEQLFPTGSYKDRGASVLISRVRALGIGKVVEDSSGNAGSSIAAYCANAGISCDIYVPESTSQGKLAQITLFGARLNKIPGSREDTAAAVLKAAETDYYASHSWNPFFFHGTKTFAFEVCEHLGWRAPDTVILPAGNGTLLLGAFIGFGELKRAGIINKIPRIIAVQAANCAPLVQAFTGNSPQIPIIEAAETVAEGIAIAAPIRGKQIIDAVRQSGGDFIAVTETEISLALAETCRKGFYIEPTSAAVVAGIKKYLRQPGADENEVIISAFTGHGLKAGEKTIKILQL